MLATLLAVVALAGAHQDEAAAGAAMASIDDDPVAAMHSECAYRSDSRLLLLEARFDCIVKICDSFFASVEIDHTLGDGWRFRVVRDRSVRPLVKTGTTAPRRHPDRPICEPRG
jgi:hypothetical protein